MSDVALNSARQLEDLLDREREKLLKGDLDDLADYVQKKSLLIEQLLKGSSPDLRALARIRKKASRNSQLLAAAVRAFRSVAGRLIAAQKPEKTLNTYTKQGERRLIGSNPNVRFERRT